MRWILLNILAMHFSSLAYAQGVGEIKSLTPESHLAGELDERYKSPVRIRWSKVAHADHYVVSVSPQETMSDGRFFSTKKTSYYFNVFLNKLYFWRVTAFDKNNKVISQSPTTPFQFKVVGSSHTETSEVLAPDDTTTSEIPDFPIVAESAPAVHEGQGRSRFSVVISGGLGISHLSYDQSGSEIREISFSSTDAPSVSLSSKITDESGFGIALSYSDRPGKIGLGSTTVDDNSFRLKEFTFDALYNRSNSPLTIYAGFGKNWLPFIEPVSLGSTILRENELLFLTIGLGYDYLYDSDWHLHLIGRYKYILDNGVDGVESWNSQSDHGVSATIGLSRQLASMDFGLYAEVQWITYKYSAFNAAVGTTDGGDNSLLFSNLEFRATYPF